MEDFATRARKRLDEVSAMMDVIDVTSMEKPRRWPWKDMCVGDVVKFYPYCQEAVRSCHSFGQKRGWKFSTRSEWPLTIVERMV